MFHIRHVNSTGSEDYPLKMRRHQGLYEFYMFLHCISPLNLITEEGEEIYCQPGSFIIFSPYKQQYWDALPPRFVHGFLSFTVDDDKYFENIGLPLDVPVYPNMNKEISDTLTVLHAELYDNNDIGKDYQIDRLINGLFIDISRKMHHIAAKNNYEKDLLTIFEETRLMMFEDPSHKVDYYANKAGFSIRRFQQYYKHFFNETPSNDLCKGKISLAKMLLNEGQSILVVAEKIGFSSVEYFNKWRKKYLINY